MSVCRTDNFTMQIPDGWVDRSMITWVAPPRAGYKVLPNLLCSKGEMQPGEDLDKYVNRQLKELMGQVKNFDLISRQQVSFAGVPAVELSFRMRPQGVMLQQKQIFFQTDLNSQMAYTVVVTAARENFEELQPMFDEILNSVSWNG